MKRLQLTLVLLTLLTGTSLVAASNEQADADERPSWIERIFGTKETAEDVKEETTKDKKKTLKFSENDRKILEEWLESNASPQATPKKKLPPGLQKKVARGGTLPPGWQKKVAVGAVLDPELDQQAGRLPGEILARLPDIPKNTEIVHIGNKIIRVIENTREIVDILDDLTPSKD